MRNLFLIDGTSGSGKSDLIEYIIKFRHNVALVPKYTTREARDYEQVHDRLLDLSFVTEDEFANLSLDYTYVYGGERYGFRKQDLTKCLESRANVFVIVRNADVIKTLKEQYSYINVKAVFVYSDQEKVRERLKQEGAQKDQIEFRIRRTKEAFDDYIVNTMLYDHVIINNSDPPTYHRLVDQLLRTYQGAPDVEEDLVFVLMSFDASNEKLPDYYAAMQRAVARVDPKLHCLNLDDVSPGSPRISDTAKQKIRNCRLAIVDLTDNSPNVFYELGYVHGIRRPCLITAQENTPRLFYPAEYRIITYSNATDLEKKVVRHLEGVLS